MEKSLLFTAIEPSLAYSKKVYNLVVNRKKVYHLMKEKGCLCRVRP